MYDCDAHIYSVGLMDAFQKHMLLKPIMVQHFFHLMLMSMFNLNPPPIYAELH